MNFEIRSKQGAKHFKWEKPWAAISVVTQEGTWPELSEDNREGLLQLYFWDVTVPNLQCVTVPNLQWVTEEYIFDDKTAGQILDFVDSVWDKVDTFLVHCEAGMSRSPGIAAAIAYCYLNPSEEEKFFNAHTPNCHVRDTMIKEYYNRKGENLPEGCLKNNKNPFLPGENEYIHTEPWDCRE